MITLSVLCTFFSVVSLMAQIPSASPIPVGFSIEAQDGFERAFTYGRPSAWCDTVIQSFSGDLVWAYGLNDSTMVEGDSLMCDSIPFTDLTGKVALIRRGACEFGWKSLRAQEAGAIAVVILNHSYENDPNGSGGLVTMGGGAVGAMVNIPAIFLTREDGDVILNKLDNGIPVTAYFDVRAFSNPRTSYTYKTPLAAVRPMADMGATFINIDDAMTLPSVTITAVITEPGGGTATISQDLTDVPPLSVNPMKFDDTYTPNAAGTYHVRFTNSLTADELEQEFVIGDDNTFAMDNGDIVPNTNGTIEPDSASFVTANFRYDFGNVYRTGSTALMATHASFMISNPDELFTDDPEADVFKIKLYNADPDGNGTIPYPAAFVSVNGLNEAGGPVIPVASAEYILSETDQPFDLLTVEFDSPVTLNADKLYLLMVEYKGEAAGLGIPPKYAFAGQDRMAGEVGTMIFTDSLHTDGWGNNYNGVVRLHLAGFTSTDEALDNSKLSLSPNPASNFINLNLELDEVADLVTVRIMDMNGRLVKTQEFENVQAGTFSFDLSGMANGSYFMGVYTPEGFRAKKFQVMH